MRKYSAKSNNGRVRQVNEDVYAVSKDTGLVILADGMGGRNSGQLAASITVETILEEFQTVPPEHISHSRLVKTVKEANRRVHSKSMEHKRHEGMGTTLIIAVLVSDKAIFCHVGDSRGYIYHSGSLQQVTVDHSAVQELVDSGKLNLEEAFRAPNRNIITRSIGTEKNVVPDITERSLTTGDILLLCSDGLSDLLTHENIANIVETHQQDLSTATDRLITAANDAGGTDNVTVILIQH